MAKGYWISAYRSIADPDKLAAYGKLAVPAIEAQGGRFLARGGRVEVREAGLKQRTVIVEFPSLDHALAAYESAAYQEALAVFDGAAERDLRLVEGVE